MAERLLDRPGPDPASADGAGAGPAEGGRGRRFSWSRSRPVLAVVATVLAALVVWFALLAPTEVGRLSPAAFARIPLEGVLFAALALALPPGGRRVLAVLFGLALGVLTIVRMIDLGFGAALGRPFDPGTDWPYFGSSVGLLSDSVGRPSAIAAVAVVCLVALGLVVLLPWSVLRLTRLVVRHRRRSIWVVLTVAMVWAACAAGGVRIAPGEPVASAEAAGLAYRQVGQVRAGIADRREFARAAAVDSYRDTPAQQLLTGLRGKDVIIAFVESYGRVAVQDSDFSDGVDAALQSGTARLARAGFASRSAFLTSPTFGGISWLAHSTFQSGLWIASQQRYNDLVSSDRFTLSDAFARAGWRTVVDVPANRRDWPEARSFYHYDAVYDARNVGYAGPRFGYAPMPDQFTLATLGRLEHLAVPHHPPVMAEIDLVSSHLPWAPLPHLVDWGAVGDGSVFDSQPAASPSTRSVWSDPARVRAAYGQSIEYSVSALVSFVENIHDDNLVLVLLGDHQPASIVSGQGAGHDVPISIVAHDPAVMTRIGGWGWQEGLRPGPTAPVWPMDRFRDRLLSAFGPRP